MAAVFDHALGLLLVGFGDEDVAGGVPELEVHADHLHVEAAGLEPVHQDDDLLLLVLHRGLEQSQICGR